jgi:hypothetical protein
VLNILREFSEGKDAVVIGSIIGKEKGLYIQIIRLRKQAIDNDLFFAEYLISMS